MKRVLCLVSALFVLAFAASQGAMAKSSAFQDDQKRLALVIGVSAYESVPALPNPKNDAEAVAAAFGRLDFEVIKTVDPSRDDLEATLAKFRSSLEGADIAVLYYAGHSIQVDGKNYIIPVDARFEEPEDFGRYLFAVEELTKLMDEKAAVRIAILDACRDNPFLVSAQEIAKTSDTKRSINAGLANISGPETIETEAQDEVYGSVIAYAASSGRTASDGEGEHSPYTRAFLEHVEKPGLEIGQMFRNIASSVIKETDNTQHPEYLVRLTNEVYFRVPEPSECDFLAAAPFNSIGVTGVDFERIDADKAIPACEAALKDDPKHPRLLYNLGRALDAKGRFEEAVKLYRQSSDLGYPAATSSLGVMYVNGQGIDQDFAEGVALLKKAKALGSRTARISLAAADFSVLFEAPETTALQERLKKEGLYKGPLDGDYGAKTQAALRSYQSLMSLRKNGATLETLDSLGLVDIIPHYELN
ncbi:His-Xaa-Ser repeat protein HxsA [Hartmannibacter diazotrophicus]|uniref:His-Xaa-Ser repeat protein HxsA n=1 Tax=Hartmannibacter diazotrophicus TaxID=1482074 RepID=A0A2C9D2R3_9HYPH|nr:caspase family protein [Hartmannibacter diazotrophicus]SON54556.1 His-Xaa-Ser repeat protein HxsA [Hartmannibacter diazotrophicus]